MAHSIRDIVKKYEKPEKEPIKRIDLTSNEPIIEGLYPQLSPRHHGPRAHFKDWLLLWHEFVNKIYFSNLDCEIRKILRVKNTRSPKSKLATDIHIELKNWSSQYLLRLVIAWLLQRNIINLSWEYENHLCGITKNWKQIMASWFLSVFLNDWFWNDY